VKSLVRPSFWRAYQALDPRVREAARRAYQLFSEDPEHPSLRFKKLQNYDNVWSVRINEQFRAVGERTGDTIEWAWIGSHNEFDSRFGKSLR
jgi:Txe/YoeB family toxin of Txe-Axe toxin-antitoxin module